MKVTDSRVNEMYVELGGLPVGGTELFQIGPDQSDPTCTRDVLAVGLAGGMRLLIFFDGAAPAALREGWKP